ncbi:MAG: Holliday junction branch migration protein RuvA [Castellaniella sp.]
MIGRIRGTLLEKTPPVVCIDVGGIGYDIDVPMSTLYELPDVGSPVTLFTHLMVRDDAHTLYGFLTARERTAFRSLIRVSGVGARTALALLSGMSVDDLVAAVTHQESAGLLRVPGIGKKTAERLLLELRDKLGAVQAVAGDTAGAATRPAGGRNDILEALMALGYSAAESQRAIKGLPADADVTDGIRQALKNLTRK